MAANARFEAPVQQTMAPVIITDPAFTTPDPEVGVAMITSEEAAAFLGLNAAGVGEFFKKKHCSEIAEVLTKQGIGGAVCANLTAAQVHTLSLPLGSRLALVGFLKRLRIAARTQQRRELLWSGAPDRSKFDKMHGHPCCGLCFCQALLAGCMDFDCCNCCAEPVAFWDLGTGTYKLTNSKLAVSEVKWDDGAPTDVPRRRLYTKIFGCPYGICGYEEEVEPHSSMRINNIDLGVLEDVDVNVNQLKPAVPNPNCARKLQGYHYEYQSYWPGKLYVTYKTPEGEVATTVLLVENAKAQEIADKILAAKEEAQAEDAGNGRVGE